MTLTRMLFVFIVFIGLNFYLFLRGWQAIPPRTDLHIIYSVLYLFASMAVFIAVFAGSKLPVWMSRIFEVVGGYWMMLFIFMLSAALLADIFRALNHYFGIYPSWISLHYAEAKVYYLGFVLFLLGCISVIGYIRFINPQITEVPIIVDRNNHHEDELNIIAISDIHLGNVIRKDRLASWVKLINRQNADIIMIAGDMFDHNMNTVESQEMDIELSRLNARYGVYAIPGNHDYYAGIDKAIMYMKKSGIRVLRDQAVTIDHRLVVIGRDDLTNRKRKSLKLLMTGVNADLPRIVLDHQPLSFAESRENNVDLHISGHTHNGQIFPINRIVSKIYELGYGYKKTGNTHYYVSSGLGLWGAPIRLGTQSEIVKFKLKTKPSLP
jgi:uncharacterized protein